VKRTFLLLIFVYSFFILAAQEQDCNQNLTDAEDSYRAGRLHDVAGKLTTCLKSGFTDAQKIEAYRLLTLTYVYLDETELAEESFLQILITDPLYVVPVTDPIEIHYISNKFTAVPIVTWHPIRLGGSLSFVNYINENYSSGIVNENSADPKFSYGLGIGLDLNFNKNLAFGLEVGLKQLKYDLRSTMFEADTITSGDQTLVEKSFTTASLPVFVRYSQYYGKFRPFVTAGYEFRFTTFQSETNTYLKDGAPTESQTYSNGGSYRRGANSIFVGGGAMYKITKTLRDYFIVDVKFSRGLHNVVKESIQYDFPNSVEATEQLFRYGHVNSLYAVNNLLLTIGYVRPIYDPRRKSPFNLKRIIGRIFSKDEE